MKNLAVGIFGDDGLGRELGKTGTKSDIEFFNRKTDEAIFTFMSPVEGKLSAKAQIMGSVDLAILSFSGMTPDFGEDVVMADSFGISSGIVLAGQQNFQQVSALLKGTSLENFVLMEKNVTGIMEFLNSAESGRSSDGGPVVAVDHSFSVKGVGEVVLGFVKIGTLRRHDKLIAMPAGKEVVVRSIQMQDRDFEEAAAGSRVGLAMKGAELDELRRGTLLCTPGSVNAAKKLSLKFRASRFYQEGLREGAFHLTVGMQTVPVRITKINGETLEIESEKDMVFMPADTFLLTDMNAKKLHVMGSGRISGL